MTSGFLAALFVFLALGDCCANDKIFNPTRVAEPNSYPMVGWIKSRARFVKCGVTLISTDTAMTAASCLADNSDVIIFGDHNRSDTDGLEQRRGVARAYTHPFYNSTSEDYDVAMIKLDSPVTMTAAVTPTEVLPERSYTSTVWTKNCRAVGWGVKVSGVSTRAVDQSDVLLEIVLKGHNSSTCADIGAPASSVCYTPFRDESSVTCEGDVGGGYFCKKGGIWYLAGVLSGWNVEENCVAGPRAFTKSTAIHDMLGLSMMKTG